MAAILAALVMVIVDENFELKKNPEKWVFSLIIHLLEGATKEVSSFEETFFVRANRKYMSKSILSTCIFPCTFPSHFLSVMVGSV